MTCVPRSALPSLRKDGGAYDTTRDPAAFAPSWTARSTATASALPTDEAPHTACRRSVRCGEDGGFAWIGLHEPTEAEFAGIAGEFGLHPLAVEDAVHAHQRPKLERYDDTLFTVFKTIHYVEHDELTATSEVVETGEVMCFTGRDFFITVRHGGQGSLRALRHRLQDDPELLSKGPSAVLHAIADHVVDGYIAVADAVQDDIDEVETEVFSPGPRKGAPRGSDAGRIYQLKREVLEFKRAVSPAAAAHAAAERAADAADRPRHPEVLPRCRRPPGARARSRSSASTNCSTRSSRPIWRRRPSRRTRTCARSRPGRRSSPCRR